MLPNLDEILTSDVYNGASNTFRRVDHDVVVLCHVERVQSLDLLSWPVHHTLVDCIRNAVVDKFCQYETILALVEHLEGVCGEGKKVADICITSEDGIDVSCELCALVF